MSPGILENKMSSTEFMHALHKSLVERKLAESTASAYIKTLTLLNDKKPFKSLTFLRKVSDIEGKISDYAPSTKRSILGAISSVLYGLKDTKGFKKLYETYKALLNKMRSGGSEEAPKEVGEKTEKEAAAWLKWDDVLKRRDELHDEIAKFKKGPRTEEEHTKLLQHVLLSLYTYVPPRRNQDYMKMYVVHKWTESMPADKNYLDLGGGKSPTRMIFNVYKTAKKHGQFIQEVPSELASALATYLNSHPNKPKGRAKVAEYPLLVDASGKHLTAVNAITRVLNKLFGRKVGSSLLRHIYLSSKYDVEEMKSDAEAMGHTIGEQRNYLRTDKDPAPPTLSVADE